MVLDLHPTLLELVGLPAGDSVSLIEPREGRIRLAEYPAVYAKPFELIGDAAPKRTVDALKRRLRALFSGPYKLIEGEDGIDELYNLAADPDETDDLAMRNAAVHDRLRKELYAEVRKLAKPGARTPAAGGPSAEEAALLAELGYSRTSHDAALSVREFEARSSWKLQH
jgi:arylsulfatase A-like enzyme